LQLLFNSFLKTSFFQKEKREMTEIKIDGHLQVKEDGLRAWIWSKRYVVLRDQTITFHRNEVKIII
jgi:hypothetical protein